MSFRSRLIASLGALAVLPAGASAQSTPGVHVDPSGSQPPGVIYQLPLDSARKDAAPQRSTTAKAKPAPRKRSSQATSAPSGGSGSGGGGGATGGGSGGGSSSGGGGGSGGTAVNASAIHSENGLGSSSKVPGVGASAKPVAVQRAAAETSGGSTGSTVPLASLAGILLLGGAAAVAGRRMAQHRQF